MKKIIFFLLLSFPFNILSDECNSTFLQNIKCNTDFFAYAGYEYILSSAGRPLKPRPIAGFSVNYSPHDWLRFTLAMNLEDTYNIDDILTFGFLTLTHKFDENWGIKLRTGRIKNQHGLYNEILNNPLLRPTLIPAQGIYFEPLRSLFQSVNGISLSVLYNDFEVGYTIGSPKVINSSLVARFLLNTDEVKLTENFGDIQNFFFNWRSSNSYWTIRGNHTISRMSPTGNNVNSVADQDYTQLGIIYDGNGWSFSAEVMNVSIPQEKFFDSAYAFSLFLDYDINERWQAYIAYNQFKVAHNKYARLTVDTKNDRINSLYARDISIGNKFYWNNFVLGAEIHLVEGAVWLPLKEQQRFNHNKWIYGAVQLFYYWD